MTERVTLRQFMGRLRVGRDRRPLTFFPTLNDAIDAYDRRDPSTGLPAYLQMLISVVKKWGKSHFLTVLDLHELYFGSVPGEPDRLVVRVANDLEQALLGHTQAVQLIRRLPKLDAATKILKNEIVFEEVITNPYTGGRHTEIHRVLYLPLDIPTSFGKDQTLMTGDEIWAWRNYAILEALAPSPARSFSRTVFASHAGLRHQQKPGVPLYDLERRVEAGDDPQLWGLILRGPEAWKAVPWITRPFIEAQRKQLATVPSRYRRLWENVPAGADGDSFLAEGELEAAIDRELEEPAEGERWQSYTCGVDLGLKRDYTAVVVTHVDPTTYRIVADVVRVWRGSPERPVSLSEVEEELVRLHTRFHFDQLTIDSWNASLLAERLRARGVRMVDEIAITPAVLDRLATELKSWFSGRLVTLPDHPVLVEQLESLTVAEVGRRKDLARFIHKPGMHDDAVFALALAGSALDREVGRSVLPPSFRGCDRALNVANFAASSCFLVDKLAGYVPSGDPACKECRGWIFAKGAYRQHLEKGGEAVGVREFRRRHLGENAFTEGVAVDRWVSSNL